tara:strand:+ start:368 stop:1546 length:1179 start_codon:yes stop_codon:yes gene_type:complete
MEQYGDKDLGKRKVYKVTTFPVPFNVGEIKENITINTNTPSKFSKEQLINQAIQFQLKGHISEATKYYQYCINKGFNDERVFYNYGIILKELGKYKEAEIYVRKAIKVKPNNFSYHYLLGQLQIKIKNLEYSSDLLEETLITMSAKRTSFFIEQNNIDTLSLGSSHGEYLFNPSLFKNSYNLCSRSQDLKYSYYLYKKLSSYLKNVIIFYSIFSSGFDLEKSAEKEIATVINEIFDLKITYQNQNLINFQNSIKDKFSDYIIAYPKNGFHPKSQFFPESYGVKRRVKDHMKFNKMNNSNKYLIEAILLSKKLNHRIAIVIPPVRSDYKSALNLNSEKLFGSLYKIVSQYNIKCINFWDDSRINDDHFGDYDHLRYNSDSSSYISKQIYKLFY